MPRIVCVTGPEKLEIHAAQELAKYVGQITGKKPRVTRRMPGNRDVVLSVGRSAAVEHLTARGILVPQVEPKSEAFVVKSVEAEGTRFLLFLGSEPRALLYAVYHYLERACRVGFFWDGERVPRLEQIPIEGIDFRSESRWPERQYLISVAYSYSAWWWGWKEWKRELDWAAKHRFNIMTCPPGAAVVWRKVWKRFGVEVPPEYLSSPPYLMFASAHTWKLKPPYPVRFQRYIDRLTKKMLYYGRSLGIRWDSPAIAGIQVPQPFYEAWKNRARFMDIRWAVFPPSKFVHPEDPLYVDMLKAFVEEYRARYGTDHFWWLPSFFEMDLMEGRTPEEQLALKSSIARRTLDAVRSVDPQAVLVCLGWTFAVQQFWPRDHVKAFLDALPEDAVRVWELWQDYAYPSKHVPRPLSEDLDQYFGKPWLLGFIHSFGGSTTLHGDLAGIIRRVRDTASDPRAFNCRGVDVQTEVINHNHLFYDLLARLAWNPEGIELEPFLREYAERRYGVVRAARMAECLAQLAASVYSTADITSPLYQLRIEETMLSPGYGYPREPTMLTLAQRQEFLPGLRRALEIALGEADSLGTDPLYQHDLIDIARQYLGDLFNSRASSLGVLLRARDSGSFERVAAELIDILDDQEALLGSSPYFRLQPLLDKARGMPGAPKDFTARARDLLTMWLDAIPDYARRDYYELVRFVYRKRVDAFLNHARERMAAGFTTTEPEVLGERYRAIERAFVAGEYERERGNGAGPSPVEVTRRILRERV